MFRIGVKSRRLNSRIFGLANKDLWRRLYLLRAGPETGPAWFPGTPNWSPRCVTGDTVPTGSVTACYCRSADPRRIGQDRFFRS